MTFSIAARCPRTGAFGVAISSSSPAVASRCAYVSASVGAVCSQNVTDPRLGPRLLELLRLGNTAQQAIDQVVGGATSDIGYRQLTAVGTAAAPAAYSGERALGTFGAVTGDDSVAAGNMLASTKVLDAMVDEFEADDSPTVSRRLLKALRGAVNSGGEEGPVHSAGLLVAHDVPWPVVDLRVDWTENDPIAELGTLLDVWEPQQDDYVQRGLHPGGAPSYGVPGDL